MTMIDDVKSFHDKFGVPVLTVPTVPSGERIALRMRLIAEEFDELREAIAVRETIDNEWLSDCDLPETADAIADLIYVLIGTAHEFGIPLQAVWDRVHAANMAKEGGGTDAKGKIQKPPGWVAPDVAGALRDAGWEP